MLRGFIPLFFILLLLIVNFCDNIYLYTGGLYMYSILLLISLAVNVFLLIYVSQISNKTKIIKWFNLFIICLITLTTASLFQSIFEPFPNIIRPEIFEYIFYLGEFPGSILCFLISLIYKNPAVNLKKYMLLFIPSIIGCAIVLTNDMHHLFFTNYSPRIANIEYGPLFFPFALYHYLLVGLSIINFIILSFKNSESFSMQTILLASSILIVTATNIIATFKILDLYVYVTPISITFLGLAIGICVIKYKFENVTPIALKTIINTMSDGLAIINHEGSILTLNKSFDEFSRQLFNLDETSRDKNLFTLLGNYDKNLSRIIKQAITKSFYNESLITEEYEFDLNGEKKYYNIDIYAITLKKDKLHIGNLLLFRDISEHKENIKILQEKQEIIIAQSRLATIGELAGGIAHDINTPISTIKTGIQMLSFSFEDEERKMLLKQMESCANKISDIANTVRNQFRNLGKQEVVKFEINKILEDIQVIVHNELKKHNCTLTLNMDEKIEITGEPTKLNQVLTNIIVNAIQVYSGTEGGPVTVNLFKKDSNIIIEIIDKAGGIKKEILPHLFKNILTTKGDKGTGLGLYLSYSVIKSEFNGDIKVESTEGVGSKFTVILPKG